MANKSEYKKKKDDLLINVKNFYDGREMIVNVFKNKIFPTVNLIEYPQYSSKEDIGEAIGENASSKSKTSSCSSSSTNKLEKLLIDSEKKNRP